MRLLIFLISIVNVLALQGRVNQLFSNKAHSYYKPASPFATRTNSRLNSFNEDVSELLALQSTAVANTINELQTLLKNFNVDSITKALTDKSLVDEISKIDFREVAKVSNSFQGFSFPSIADIQSLLNSIGNVDSKSLWHLAEVLAAEPSFLPSFLAVVFILVVFGVGYDDRLVDSPYAKGDYKYDADACDRYYSSRFSFVFKRLFKLLTITGGFNIRLLLDYQFGDVQKNEAQRAKEALALATQLGPTFIKLGQALSIRTDLIPEPYALELRKLQDAVPPFDSENARKIICEELEISSINEVFSTLSDKPVASASIGQVYRGKLIGGTEVAVKVQRPNILKEISLDLYLLRKLTPLQVIIANQGRTAKLDEQDFENAFRFVDAWGQGLVAEVDYQLEASNTKAFGEAMKARGLDAVVAPTVVDPLTRSRVLVTEWVEGTRLDRDASADVPRLCGVALNAYLTMLLDTGVLHCDPHPGNLLRTTDGKLCILDWGMTLALPKDLQYALLEFIAHINSESYDDIPQDFINLGFSPPDKLERLKRSGLTDGFAFTLRQLSGGGGAKKTQERLKQSLLERYGDNLSDDELRKKAREEMMQQMEDQLKQEGVDVGGVSNMMEEISKRNKEIFQVPPYVLYTTRAFSTLEGIGLSVNEDYAIVQECYPYLAKRLMTDDSPRSRNALRNMLVKSTTGVLSPSKLIEMSEGFNSYTASTVSIDNTGAGMQQAQEEFIELLLSPKGNLIQDLVIEAAANVTDSLIRESLHRVKLSPGGQLVKSILKAPKNVVKAVVPSPFRMMLAPFTLPLTLPYDVAKAVVNIGSKSDSDRAAIESAEAFWNVAREQIVKRVRTFADEENVDLSFLGSSPQLLNPSVVRNALSDDRVRKRLPVLVSMSGRFGSSVLHRLADRVQHRNMSSIPVLKSTALPSEVGANNNSEISSLLQSIITSEEPDAIEALIDRVVSTATSESARRIAEVIDERVKSQMVIESPSASEQVLSAGFLASTSGLSKELPK